MFQPAPNTSPTQVGRTFLDVPAASLRQLERLPRGARGLSASRRDAIHRTERPLRRLCAEPPDPFRAVILQVLSAEAMVRSVGVLLVAVLVARVPVAVPQYPAAPFDGVAGVSGLSTSNDGYRVGLSWSAAAFTLSR